MLDLDRRTSIPARSVNGYTALKIYSVNTFSRYLILRIFLTVGYYKRAAIFSTNKGKNSKSLPTVSFDNLKRRR